MGSSPTLATKHYNEMKYNINPKVGDLVIWYDGPIGILYKKVDLYAHMKVASRNYSPRWRWLIEFNGNIPWNYSPRLGVTEKQLLDGDFGKIIGNDE